MDLGNTSVMMHVSQTQSCAASCVMMMEILGITMFVRLMVLIVLRRDSVTAPTQPSVREFHALTSVVAETFGIEL